jgi:hypothetical protein
MSIVFLRHVISGSLALAFVIHTCRAHGTTFPVTLTTTALDRSSSRWFAASACTAAAEGHQATTPSSSISCTAPHPATWPSTSSLLQRTWHTLGRISAASRLLSFAAASSPMRSRASLRPRASSWCGAEVSSRRLHLRNLSTLLRRNDTPAFTQNKPRHPPRRAGSSLLLLAAGGLKQQPRSGGRKGDKAEV